MLGTQIFKIVKCQFLARSLIKVEFAVIKCALCTQLNVKPFLTIQGVSLKWMEFQYGEKHRS